MSPALTRDGEALDRALEADGDEMDVRLSRETIEMMARAIHAQEKGQELIVTHGLQEVSPAEAGLMLGMSRPQVRKLIDSGQLPFRMVGAHHRIAVEDIEAWQAVERKRRREALARFSALENELGLFE